MTAQHMIEKCQHGTVHAQCRCPAPDKTLKIVPCDPRVCRHDQLTLTHKINSVLFKIPTTEDQLNPTEDQFEAAESILIELIKAQGFDHLEAGRIVRSIHWYGWNNGYSKGQNR